MWARPGVAGTPPPPRCAHTTTLCLNKLFVFGGWNGTRMIDDMHVLTLAPGSLTWTQPTIGNASAGPRERGGHTATAFNNYIYVFGGGDGSHYLNDLYVFDANTSSWSRAYVAGMTPAARSRHSATVVGKKLFVFGGGDDQRVYNDVYVLDLDSHEWSRPAVSGSVPSARWGHTATAMGNIIYMFGGHDGTNMLNDMHTLDTERMVWTLIAKSTPSNNPTPRAGQSATVLSPKTFLMFGGGDGTGVLNDLWLYDVEKSAWCKPAATGTSPPGRCAHSATMVGPHLYVYGGGDDSRRFKDLYQLDAARVLQNYENAELMKQRAQERLRRLSQDVASDPSLASAELDIATWLSSMSLHKYAPILIERGIQFKHLISMTDADLEQLGVSAKGARRRILTAVEGLKERIGEKNSPVRQRAAASSEKIAVIKVDGAAEPVVSTTAAAPATGAAPASTAAAQPASAQPTAAATAGAAAPGPSAPAPAPPAAVPLSSTHAAPMPQQAPIMQHVMPTRGAAPVISHHHAHHVPNHHHNMYRQAPQYAVSSMPMAPMVDPALAAAHVAAMEQMTRVAVNLTAAVEKLTGVVDQLTAEVRAKNSPNATALASALQDTTKSVEQVAAVIAGSVDARSA